MKKRVVLLVVLLLAAMTSTAAILQRQQLLLSEKIIRLHVVANSDSDEDQQVKLLVRDAVIAKLEGIERDVLPSLLTDIEQAALECLQRQGRNDRVQVTLGIEKFPTRVYETFSLPSGTYTSLRITIGEGAGQNWWCVAFPSICFCATAAEFETMAVSAGFTEKEICLITEESSPYQIKFKSLELLDRLKSMLFR